MARSEPDAVTLLKRDHAEVKNLFERFEDSEERQEKQMLADRICKMLTAHATYEEELLYPRAHDLLAEDEEDEELVHEAEVEHQAAKRLIAEIESMTPDDEKFAASVKVLGEYVNHHVREEEREMFPKLKRAGLDLAEVGAMLHDRKRELMAQLGIEEMDESEMPRKRPRKRPTTRRRAASRAGGRARARSSGAGRGRARKRGSSRRSGRASQGRR
jgi:hemerythrin superfamily protein